MKKIFFSLLLVLPITAFAEPAVVKFDAYCSGEAELTRILVKYDENPMMTMLSGRSAEGTDVKFPTVLFANPKTRTWTLVERVGEDMFCVVGTGAEITPYIDDGKSSSKHMSQK